MMSMKYAFMTFSTPEQTVEEVLATANRYDYAGVEPRVSNAQRHGIDVSLDADARERVRRQFEDSGVAMCCLAVSCRYADPAATAEAVEQTETFIDLAADLSCPRLRVFGGKLAEGQTRTAATRQIADALASVANHAMARGVTICLETHDDWTEPREVAAVMEAVAHPNVAVNWDIMHPCRISGRTIDETYDVLKPWIRHVHVHDGVTGAEHKVSFKPIGEGEIDHRRALERLIEDGYTGFISGEWINWEPPEMHLPRELARLRALEHQAATATR